MSGRLHKTKLGNKISSSCDINCSIVQGFTMRPFHYSIYSSHLKPVFNNKIIVKFANDITYVVLQDTRVNIEIEFDNAKVWAKKNEIFINTVKTRDLIIFRNSVAKEIYTNKILLISCIERVEEIKLFGDE